jgi:dUTP pyrophosphatase
MKLLIQKLHPDAMTPTFAVVIPPGARVQVPTGIACAIPLGYAGLFWDKSGLSHKRGLKVMGGVIDAGYRGELLVGLMNLGSEPHSIGKGDKITQMLIQKVEHPELVVVETLDATVRGEGGFGSTGT